MNKIKNFIRRWLGFGNMFMGVDVNFFDQSCIIIVSKLKGGQIRVLNCKFESYQDLEYKVKELQLQYGISNKNVIKDLPHRFKN